MKTILQLLSRKFDLFFVENGRSPDLFFIISPSQNKSVVLKKIITQINEILKQGQYKTHSCGNSSGISPDSLLIDVVINNVSLSAVERLFLNEKVEISTDFVKPKFAAKIEY